MSFEWNGKTIETTETGYLVNAEDWTEDLAGELARREGVDLTQEHWDLVHYLREEFFNNNQNQPNNRQINKYLADKWGKKVGSKEVYDLFPGNPSKQAGLIGGLPESRRKGGY